MRLFFSLRPRPIRVKRERGENSCSQHQTFVQAADAGRRLRDWNASKHSSWCRTPLCWKLDSGAPSGQNRLYDDDLEPLKEFSLYKLEILNVCKVDNSQVLKVWSDIWKSIMWQNDKFKKSVKFTSLQSDKFASLKVENLWVLKWQQRNLWSGKLRVHKI